MGPDMSMRVLLMSTLVMAVAIYAVTEVQELGNDDSSAAGNVDVAADEAPSEAQLSSADGDDADDEEDELGEGVGARRGGAFLSTTGSFTLQAGGAGGNTEEDD